MPSCSAVNCYNSTAKEFRLHAFPVNIDRRRLWAERSGRDFTSFQNGLPTTNMRLCEQHFNNHQYIVNAHDERKLKHDAVPTIFHHPGNRENQFEHDEDLDEDDVYGCHQNVNDEEFDNEPPPRDIGNADEPLQGHAPDYAVLEMLLEQANREKRDLRARMADLQRNNHDLQRKLRSSKASNAVFEENLEKFLERDQIQRLRVAGNGTGFVWSEKTIKKALQIRIMVGVKGYEYLRTVAGYPLPSYRTLCRRLEGCIFPAGSDNDIIPHLGMKMREEEEKNRNCYISLDEMEMDKAIEYDKGLRQFVGFVTPEIAANEEEKGTVASRVLVFVVRGLTLKWKQIVAYYLVDKTTDVEKIWECCLTIIRRLHEEGLNVRGLVMDMGPKNTAIWRYLGVHSVPGSIRNAIDHPIINGQKLYVSPDLGHLLKNLSTALLVQDLYLPPELADEHPEWDGHLTVSLQHVKKLIELQEQPADRGVTLQYKLEKYHVQPGRWDKMRVPYAAQVLSRSTAIALKFCAESEAIPEIDSTALPIAWFFEQVDSWFSIMNDRRNGLNNDDSGNRKIAIIEDFSRLFFSVTFQKRGWKPLHTGVSLATKTVVDLHSDFVRNGHYRYLLPGRLTSDCLENVFSQLRQMIRLHPSPVGIRHGLRLLSVSQFFHVPRGSNYAEDDDAQYIVEFLRIRGRPPPTPNEIEDEDFADVEQLTELQSQGLYKLAGWIAMKVNSRIHCQFCHDMAISDEALENCPSEWTAMLSRGLTHPSILVYRIVETAEEVFNRLKDTLLHCNYPIETLREQIFLELDPHLLDEIIPDCQHDLLSAIITKFMKFRVHVLASDRTRRIPGEIAQGGRACWMATAAHNR